MSKKPEEKKPHGNTGNSYAMHERVPKSTQIKVRCTPAQHKQIVKNAEDAEMSISCYVLDRCL